MHHTDVYGSSKLNTNRSSGFNAVNIINSKIFRQQNLQAPFRQKLQSIQVSGSFLNRTMAFFLLLF